MTEEDKKVEEKTYEPKIVKVFGKEFDVNDPLQQAQLEAWDEAMRSMQGKQSNELGELRKFKKELEPALNNEQLKSKVKELTEDGRTDEIAELLIANNQKQFSDFRAQLEAEKGNDRLWRKYFASRPDLLDTFEEDMIRSYSEQNLGIFDADDPFKTLDSYWKPKAKSKKEFDSAEPVDTKVSADVTNVTRTTPEPAKKDDSPSAPSLDEIFDRAFSAKKSS